MENPRLTENPRWANRLLAESPPMGAPGFKFSGGKPPADAMPPLVDVSFVKRSFLDVKYGDESPAQTMDIFLPDEGEGPFPLFIHIHGGGFAVGDKRDGHVKKLLDAIQKGYAFASINYRLSDEAIFPAAVLDCRNAIRFLKENAAKYSIIPDRIATIGGSAGGNLSAMLAMNVPNGEFLGEEGKTYKHCPCIKAAIDWFGRRTLQEWTSRRLPTAYRSPITARIIRQSPTIWASRSVRSIKTLSQRQIL